MRVPALIIAAAMLLVPSTVLAKKQQKKTIKLGPVVTATATGPTITTPAGTSTATAGCPKGLRAVGGGFSAPFKSDGAMVVTSSYRSSRGSWQVTGTLVSGSGAATAYAYCRQTKLKVADATASGTLPSGSGQSATVQAACKQGAVALGGGFQMTAGPLAGHLPIPEQSMIGGPGPGAPLTARWQVVAQNSNTGEQTITTHVYCATGIKGPALTQTPVSGEVPLFASLTASSACPPVRHTRRSKKQKMPKQLLSAGGFNSPFTQGVLPVHTDSRIAGNDFIDTGVNGGSVTGPMTLQSQAICF